MLWGALTLQFHHCTLSFKNISHKTNNTPNRKYSTFSLQQPPTTTYYMYLLRQNTRNWQQIEQQYVYIHKTNNTPTIYSTFSLHASHLLAPKQQPTTLFYNLRELRSRYYSPFSNPSVCPQKEECKLQTSCHSCKREMTIAHYYDNLNDVN